MPSRTIDNAFTAKSIKGPAPTRPYAGALSFMRRKATPRSWPAWMPSSGAFPSMPRLQPAGHAFRATRHPRGIGDLRQRSAISVQPRSVRKHGGDRLRRLPARLRRPSEDAGGDREGSHQDPRSRRVPATRSAATTYVTWPLLKAHAAKYGPAGAHPVRCASGHLVRRGSAHRPRLLRGPRRARRRHRHRRSIQIGIRTHAPDDCGIKILYGHEVEDMSAGEIAKAIIDTVGDALLPHLRHRLPRSGLCAGHRHAGFRRAVEREDAVGAAASARQARYPRRRRRRGLAALRPCAISPPSPGRRSRCICWG
jgi:agmatinase